MDTPRSWVSIRVSSLYAGICLALTKLITSASVRNFAPSWKHKGWREKIQTLLVKILLDFKKKKKSNNYTLLKESTANIRFYSRQTYDQKLSRSDTHLYTYMRKTPKIWYAMNDEADPSSHSS